MGPIYLDTKLLIYAVEAVPVFATHVTRRMEEVARSREHRFAISPLVKTECLVRPIRTQDLALEGYFEAFFSRFETLPMPEAVFRGAARAPRPAHAGCAAPGVRRASRLPSVLDQ